MRNNVKINIQNLKIGKRKISYTSVNEILKEGSNSRTFQFKSSQPHGIETGNIVSLRLNKHPYLPVEFDFQISKIDNYTFEIEIPLYATFEMENYGTSLELVTKEDEEGNKYETYEYVGNAQLYLVNDSILKYINDYHNIKLKYYDEPLEGYMIYDNLPEGDDEHLYTHSIYCNKPLSFTNVGKIDVLLEWYLTKDNKFNTLIEIFETSGNVSIPLLFNNRETNKFIDEQLTLNQYMKDVEDTIIPETIDYEKRQFLPIVKTTENGKDVYSYVDKIVFNLHFRNRYDLNNPEVLTSNWTTNDFLFWNCMDVSRGNDGDTEKDDTLYYTINGYDDSMGDELNHLGFTEDDIRYNKKRLKNSFIRLSFYSDKSMLSKQLLFYSTIFFDTNTLFKKYVNVKEHGYECFDKQRLDPSLRLDAQFEVTGKYNFNKSSEGFYIYLFPDEISENASTTIYMKVEFNHAGYGKTIPMMLPIDNNGNVIESGSKNFPLNFMTNINGLDNDFVKYQDNIMIPLEISYDKNLKEYVYSFPFIKKNSNKIVLNLFEPRIRGLETNGTY